MKVSATVTSNLDETMPARVQAATLAITGVVAAVGGTVKQAWRSQVASVLGARLGNAVRMDVYPKGRPSPNAAALVYTKAPEIIKAHERGALIRPVSGGLYLAIPTDAAGAGRPTPGEWQFRTGRKLVLVPPGPGRRHALLVTSGGAGLNRRGVARAIRRRRRRDGILTGEASIVVFTLVPQVKLPKRLNLTASAQGIARAGLSGRLRTAVKAVP